jgi:RNA polymerase sigma-70 factor (ECF subfamily)
MRNCDEIIVDRVRSGHKNDFRELVLRHEKGLYWYLRNLVNQDREEVEDLLQEVFLKAYENLMDFDKKNKFSS